MSPTLTSIAMLLSFVLAPTPTGVGAPPSDAESPVPLSPSDPSTVAPIPPALEPSPVAAYCAGCGGGCDFDAGSSCAPAGVYGMDACSTDIHDLDYGGDEPLTVCQCDRSGGSLCEGTLAFGSIERDAMEQEAITVVASGGTLPADGPFFVALNRHESVVRWKCSGTVAGRVAIA